MFFSNIGHAWLGMEQKKYFSPNIWFITTMQFSSSSSNLLHLWVATGMGDGQKFIVQAARRGSIQVHQHLLRSPRRVLSYLVATQKLVGRAHSFHTGHKGWLLRPLLQFLNICRDRLQQSLYTGHWPGNPKFSNFQISCKMKVLSDMLNFVKID